MSHTPTVAQAMVSILEAVGIDACFGVPGGQTIPFYEAAREAGYHHVLMRDERNCACAADAYARVSGKVGICDATVGPGVTNLVSGVAEAYASSVPMIALIADVETHLDHLRHRSLVAQGLEQRPLLESCSKWIGRVQTAEMLMNTVAHALRVATSGRPGPVVLEIPQEIWEAPVTNLDLSLFSPNDAAWPRYRTAAPQASIDQAVATLLAAKRPIILAGGGSMASGAHEEVLALAEEFNIPVATSMNAKGIIDEHHPLALGTIGMFGKVACSFTAQQADVVLVLGSKFSQFNSFAWQLPEKTQHLIHIDMDGEELSRAIPAAQGIVADIKEATRQILAGLRAQTTTPDFSWQPVGELPSQPGTAADDPAIAPEAVITELSQQSGENTILVADASLCSGWCASRYQVTGAGRKFIAPRGLAGLGWACGAGIGAALAAPEGTRIVVVAGDGASAYWLGEIETAVRLNLSITFLILNNASFGWVVQVERSRGMDQESTFSPIDFATVGKGVGAKGTRAFSIEEVAAGLRQSFDSKGPFVLDALTSDQADVSIYYDRIVPDKKTTDGIYQT